MPQSKKNDGMIMQAGILAVAGIIVRIIGLLYNSPMAVILGMKESDITIWRTMLIPLCF